MILVPRVVKSKTTTSPSKNLQYLFNDMCKTLYVFNPLHGGNIVSIHGGNIRHAKFKSIETNYKMYGLDTRSYIFRKIWNNMQYEIKFAQSLAILEGKIKTFSELKNPLATCAVQAVHY